MKRCIALCISFVILLSTVACSGTDSSVPDSATVDVFLYMEGGSGKASVEEETIATSLEDGTKTVRVTWSSPNYDYMLVDGEKYLPVNSDGNSVFEIPFQEMNTWFTVVADTVAMSTPHEIEYKLLVSEQKLDDEDSASGASSTSDVDTEEIENWIAKNLEDETEVELQYATGFRIRQYAKDIAVVVIKEQDYYLLADEDEKLVSDLPDGMTWINRNPNQIYVVGTGSMDFFVAADALNQVKYSSMKEADCYLNEVKSKLIDGTITYAGKYSAPDYELLRSSGCDLIVENTMIHHSPAVLEKLRELGFPVMIDYASYEETILGRMEWVKLYGFLTGHMEEACASFDEQLEDIEDASAWEDSAKTDSAKMDSAKKTIGFFAITSQGTITIRKKADYICNMISYAGGEYGFIDLAEEGTGSYTVQMEAFYEAARDCDILIYNSTIEGEVSSKEELASKMELLTNMKAYQNDEIYCTKASFYQSVMELGQITEEMRGILSGEDRNYTYMEKL